jgi:hypothetical protein
VSQGIPSDCDDDSSEEGSWWQRVESNHRGRLRGHLIYRQVPVPTGLRCRGDGVADGTRTRDFQGHILALYRLSYGHYACSWRWEEESNP